MAAWIEGFVDRGCILGGGPTQVSSEGGSDQTEISVDPSTRNESWRELNQGPKTGGRGKNPFRQLGCDKGT